MSKKLLASVPLFERLSSKQQSLIYGLGRVCTYEIGEAINQEGKTGADLVIVLDGNIQTLARGVPLNIKLCAGKITGEMSFFSGKPYAGQTTALTKVRTFEIPQLVLKKFLDTHPEIGLNVYQEFANEILDKYYAVLDQVISISLSDTPRNFAHDIQSPLAALRALARSECTEIPKFERQTLNDILERIERLTSSVLDSFCVPTQKVSSQRLTFRSAEKILKQILVDVQPPKPIPILVADRSQVEVDLKINPGHFEQIASNLISNSIKATASGGSIKVYLTGTSNRAILRVVDGGIGISKSILRKLGHARITGGFCKGTGIGLYNCIRIVDSISGSIDISSSRGKGTKVSVEIPVM